MYEVNHLSSEDVDMSTIAVIGTGRVGLGFAEAAVAAGHRVVLANSRGPETLTDAVTSLGASAVADTVDGAADRADMVLLAVPLHSYADLPASALDERIVMDAGNYYTDWSGHIAELDDESTTTSERFQGMFPSARVVKAFNSIYAEDIAVDARPLGGDRRALPVAGDDEGAKQAVTDLIESIGFDVVDAGALSEGWRFQRGTDAYVVPLNRDELISALQHARRYRDMATDDLTTERTHRMPEN
ncbi:NADPH-dependent F420 reductase [Agreia sp. Leaf244]|uniref:NADPH-dependent F420 reductase n=1 Tax=Agreia sp. Leaf244 TaxID=1736305 RepID=UPI001F3CD3D0|nr:NADPH-dependent F420 reductase [Agreia sp. Leaf244]